MRTTTAGSSPSTTAAVRTARCGSPRSTSRCRSRSRSSTPSAPTRSSSSRPLLGGLGVAHLGACLAPPAAELQAEQAEAEAGQAGPQPPLVAGVLEPAVERQQGEEADQPERRTDLDGPDAVDVEGLDVGHEERPVAELVRPRLLLVELYARHASRRAPILGCCGP